MTALRTLVAAAAFGLAAAGVGWAACVSDADCSDGLPCNGAETCDLDTGDCASGTPAPDNVVCDDGVPCTIGDTCQGGICTAGLGADTDNDGDCDADEADCGCDPSDPREVCPLPNRLVGQAGSAAGEVLLEWHTPTTQRVAVATDPSCAPAGSCTSGRCTRGRIMDLCTNDVDCDLPADTCRVIVNFGDTDDLTLDFARVGVTPAPGFEPPAPGCSRKADVTLDPARRAGVLALKLHGTVGGIVRRDRDRIRYQR